MDCEEKQRLLAIYEDFAMRYASALSERTIRKGKMAKTEYNALYQMTEALRLDSNLSREALEAHVREHRC
jgi:hypothetical protein